MKKFDDRTRKVLRVQTDKVLACSRPRNKEFYELWFDYLQLANEIEPSFEAALASPRRDNYRGWSSVKGKDFKTWLEESKWALARPCTRTLEPGEKAVRGEITIAVRLDRSAEFIKEELFARLMYRINYMRALKYYEPVEEEKVQPAALREYWILLKADRQADERRIDKKKSNSVPFVCNYFNEIAVRYPYLKKIRLSDSNPRQIRQRVSRGVNCANEIISNIAIGEFPGGYNDQTKESVRKRLQTPIPTNEFARLAWRLVNNKDEIEPAQLNRSIRFPFW